MVIALRVGQFLSEIKLVITNRTPATRSCDFVITRLISDQIALHSVQLHCKFKRVVLTPRGHFRPFGKRVVSTRRKGRFNLKGSFDSMEGPK